MFSKGIGDSFPCFYHIGFFCKVFIAKCLCHSLFHSGVSHAKKKKKDRCIKILRDILRGVPSSKYLSLDALSVSWHGVKYHSCAHLPKATGVAMCVWTWLCRDPRSGTGLPLSAHILDLTPLGEVMNRAKQDSPRRHSRSESSSRARKFYTTLTKGGACLAFFFPLWYLLRCCDVDKAIRAANG